MPSKALKIAYVFLVKTKKAGSGRLQITYYFIFMSKFNFRSLKSLFLNQNRLITLPDELGNTVNKSLLHFDRLIFGIALKKKGHDYPLFGWMVSSIKLVYLRRHNLLSWERWTLKLISSAICVQLFTSSHIWIWIIKKTIEFLQKALDFFHYCTPCPKKNCQFVFWPQLLQILLLIFG